MSADVILTSHESVPVGKLKPTGHNIQHSQETVYRFLLSIVKSWNPEDVLHEFKHLFIYYDGNSTSSEALRAMADIIFFNSEEEFINTIKRSCYILINNWDTARQYKYIGELVQLFTGLKFVKKTISPTLSRLRTWLCNFVNSQDYEELKLFAARFQEHTKPHWSTRYTSYLLVPQYVDTTNPLEQREAARSLSQHLKEKFKFDLAMYTARSQSKITRERMPENPTTLGEEVLRLIKTIIVKKGLFNYANLANIFLKQTQDLKYKYFKSSLRKYLIFSLTNESFIQNMNQNISDKLAHLYVDYNDDVIDDALLLRTCNKVIEYLTIENHKEPSSLFVSLVSQGNPLTLVIVMLKIILISRNSRTHLENCIAELLKYYMTYPEEQCSWLINFMDIFNVTFTIYAENVEYNLINMKAKPNKKDLKSDVDDYRVFSQIRWNHQPEVNEENPIAEKKL